MDYSVNSKKKDDLVHSISCFSDSFKRFVASKKSPTSNYTSDDHLDNLQAIRDSLELSCLDAPSNAPSSLDPPNIDLTDEMLHRVQNLRHENSKRLSQLSDHYSYRTGGRSLDSLHVLSQPRSYRPPVSLISSPSESPHSDGSSTIVTLSSDDQDIEVDLDRSHITSSPSSVSQRRSSDAYLSDSSGTSDSYFEEVRLRRRKSRSQKPLNKTIRSASSQKVTSPKMSRTLKEYLEEKEAEKVYKPVFKANPVPKSTKEARFQKIQKKQLLRSREIKKKSLEVMESLEAPFSFYDRELWKKGGKNRPQSVPKYSDYPSLDVIPPPKPSFKANPVPEASKTEIYYEEMSKKRLRSKNVWQNVLKSFYLKHLFLPEWNFGRKYKRNRQGSQRTGETSRSNLKSRDQYQTSSDFKKNSEIHLTNVNLQSN
ncbi:hypothetical protein GEMRC1_001854 [Eukaryota sp. GEM-RC1]